MTAEVKTVNSIGISGISVDNGVHRMVLDALHKEVRIFNYYTNEKGELKLRTIYADSLESIMEHLATEVSNN